MGYFIMSNCMPQKGCPLLLMPFHDLLPSPYVQVYILLFAPEPYVPLYLTLSSCPALCWAWLLESLRANCKDFRYPGVFIHFPTWWSFWLQPLSTSIRISFSPKPSVQHSVLLSPTTQANQHISRVLLITANLQHQLLPWHSFVFIV